MVYYFREDAGHVILGRGGSVPEPDVLDLVFRNRPQIPVEVQMRAVVGLGAVKRE